MATLHNAARPALGLLAAVPVLASLLVTGCAQRRAYYAPYAQPPVVVVHHYGYGYGGGAPVVHVYHGGGYRRAPMVVHHYYHR